MDHAEDVDRLFSWLKAPMVHYRDFAPQIEVAEAMATWPVVHKAAVQTGIATEEEPAPHGDIAARERTVRDRMTMPPAVAAAIAGSPPPGTAAATAPTPPDEASSGRLFAARGDPAPAGLAPAEPASEPEPQPMSRQAAASEGVPATRHDPSPERGALFGGEYRRRERQAQPAPVADRQERSLAAVFARLSSAPPSSARLSGARPSGAPDSLPDPRSRARATPRPGTFVGRTR